MSCTCPGKRKRRLVKGDIRLHWRVLQRPTEWCEYLGEPVPAVYRATFAVVCLRCLARWNSRSPLCGQLLEPSEQEEEDLAAGIKRDGMAAKDRAPAATSPQRTIVTDYKARAAGEV